MADENADYLQLRTAKRRAALVGGILEGETSVPATGG